MVLRFGACFCIFYLFLIQVLHCQNMPFNSSNYPIYSKNDLGLTTVDQRFQIKVYAPTADSVRFNIYKNGQGGAPSLTEYGVKTEQGVWLCVLPEKWLKHYYTIQTLRRGIWSHEVCDPYAKIVGGNGDRAYLLTDIFKQKKVSTKPIKTRPYTDASIYELHLRDISVHPSSGVKNKGTFLGFSEIDSKSPQGLLTGLSHIKDMGFTHVHILPFFDFKSIDETKKPYNYNWGYDPKNYNALEGSFATDVYNPLTRIQEFKKMVDAIHNQGIKVIMDVVYNHTGASQESNFHQIEPGYYHRIKPDGKWSDASACGNETASERPMMRKFMIESLLHWMKNFGIDGFRFDLMGIHDIGTMNEISMAIKKENPDALLYGEGWTAGDAMIPEPNRALKKYVSKLDQIAVFSDDYRDGIKGYVFDSKSLGFVQGNNSMMETIKFGFVGSMDHPQVDMSKCFYDKIPYANATGQVIQYADCHDNLCLWDKVLASTPHTNSKDRIAMHTMALGLVFTSQGIPFIAAGTEFLRDKKGVENSFESPDSVNSIDWNLKSKNIEVCNFTKKLMAIRKAHKLFRMNSKSEIQRQVSFEKSTDWVFVAELSRGKMKDSWKKAMVIANSSNEEKELNLPNPGWQLAISNQVIGSFVSNIKIPPHGFCILYKK